ncbi:P-II family nitrogen regulator [Virgibacillus sp. NKC19-3]|uniref:P-II family nitrogen regulator n=1 Tax=Virgibacillus saliphilus TaxID=2831674 RepID=UPI001C9B12AE|nr:P-II family nitrogen regulator [Virgibacillus sp. NKC19-3]MBY7145040.1 P-II family nitrogen regulator [Virgibacillus sp. NKC19-3]
MTKGKPGRKLLVTIVKKERAKKVIQASKKAGAQGGTTFFGKGFRSNDKHRFFGIPVEREREIILTIVPTDIFPDVMNAIIDAVHLNRPFQGIGFVIDMKKVSGIAHMVGLNTETEETDNKGGYDIMDQQKVMYDLIMTIVNKGDADKVVDSSKAAGAEGGTIMHGRGTGIHEKAKLFHIQIEPEKEVVLTLISRDKTNDVLAAIEKGAELNEPGNGIAFVVEVEKTVGIHHLLDHMARFDE